MSQLRSVLAKVYSSAYRMSPIYLRFILGRHRRNFRIYTHMTEVELLKLYAVSLSLPRGSRAVEIGSYLGASSCFLAAGIDERNGRLYCVDTWRNDGMSEGVRDTYDQFLKNINPYKHMIEPIRQLSNEAATSFLSKINLLFLDGDHSYEAVVKDLASWLPKTTPGAWLLLHDSGWADGVKRAIQEFVLPIEVGRPHILPNLYSVRVDWTKRNEQ